MFQLLTFLNQSSMGHVTHTASYCCLLVLWYIYSYIDTPYMTISNSLQFCCISHAVSTKRHQSVSYSANTYFGHQVQPVLATYCITHFTEELQKAGILFPLFSWRPLDIDIRIQEEAKFGSLNTFGHFFSAEEFVFILAHQKQCQQFWF